MKYNLMIVDDHKMFLDGLISILSFESDYNIVLTTTKAKTIIKYLEINSKEKIDLIITDISMPEIDGVTFNKEIRKKYPNVKVLVVSMLNEPEIIEELMNNEVDGYVPKNTEKQELLLAIQTILKGEKYFSREIKDIYFKSKLSKKKEEEVKLTQREIDVISLVAQEFTSLEIASKLNLSKNTIESYRRNLIAKLNVRNLAGLTKYALKKKYIRE